MPKVPLDPKVEARLFGPTVKSWWVCACRINLPHTLLTVWPLLNKATPAQNNTHTGNVPSVGLLCTLIGCWGDQDVSEGSVNHNEDKSDWEVANKTNNFFYQFCFVSALVCKSGTVFLSWQYFSIFKYKNDNLILQFYSLLHHMHTILHTLSIWFYVTSGSHRLPNSFPSNSN